MNLSQLRSRCKPHLWFQLYWVVYLVWFFWLDFYDQRPEIHSSTARWMTASPSTSGFVFPYCSWFLLLAGVTALLWWYDTASYDKLCLSMFAGMTFCLIVYMVLPQRSWTSAPQQKQSGAATLPCASCSCCGARTPRSTSARPSTARARPAWRWPSAAAPSPRSARGLKVLAWVWAALICASTVFTKQHSIVDVVCGLAVAFVWVPVLYRPHRKNS